MSFLDKKKRYVCGNSNDPTKAAALAILTVALLLMATMMSPALGRLVQSAAAVELTAATDADDDDDGDNRSGTSGDNEDNNNNSELKQYALQRINEDRAKFGIAPVSMGDNMAAQVHAKDVLKTRMISHWTTDGEKPYMTYSRLGGEGAVAQNVATSGYPQDYDGCVSGTLLCEKTDPRKAIDQVEYNMMDKDKECCDDGHRNNILDKHHTHVSIGIAYDDYFFVMVQNFEDKYTVWTHRISEEQEETDANNNNDDSDDNSGQQQQMEMITMSGSLVDNRGDSSTDNNNDDGDGGLSLVNVQVYYDSLPTPEIYEQHRDDKSYGLGKLIALVAEPAPEGTAYKQPDKFSIIEAQNWQVQGSEFDIAFSLQELSDTYGKGVYTIVMLAQNSEDEVLPTSETSVFVN
jgi:uncharacterized protein YkwD